MSDKVDLLKLMSHLQVKPKALYCTGSNNCWCAKLEARLEFKPGYDNCMTPKELLHEYSGALSVKDKLYLTSLLEREFIW